jgi:hypothetical protein
VEGKCTTTARDKKNAYKILLQNVKGVFPVRNLGVDPGKKGQKLIIHKISSV